MIYRKNPVNPVMGNTDSSVLPSLFGVSHGLGKGVRKEGMTVILGWTR
jgi:hypothetical protein